MITGSLPAPEIKPGIRYTAPDAHIIIVDDTRTNLFVASSLLKRTRISIDTAASASEFIEKAGRTVYDVMFVDYRMPGMDGLEAIGKLRAAGGPNADTPVVMMTADTDPAAMEQFKNSGIAYSISKPLDPVYYEAFVAAVLPQEKVILGKDPNIV